MYVRPAVRVTRIRVLTGVFVVQILSALNSIMHLLFRTFNDHAYVWVSGDQIKNLWVRSGWISTALLSFSAL